MRLRNSTKRKPKNMRPKKRGLLPDLDEVPQVADEMEIPDVCLGGAGTKS